MPQTILFYSNPAPLTLERYAYHPGTYSGELTVSFGLLDPDDRTPRNPGTDDAAGCLVCHCYISWRPDDALHPAGWVYGYALEYRDVFAADARSIAVKYKYITTLQRKLERLEDDHGAPRSFGEYVQRVALAAGKVDLWTRPHTDGSLSLNRGDWTRTPSTSIARTVDGTLNRLIEEVANRA